MQKILDLYDSTTKNLKNANDYLWPLLLRVILFWEFWEAGKEKFNGENWFEHVQDKFPIPFDLLSTNINWFAATWGELIFSVMLLFGLFTRFAAISLIVITGVATAAVHWPESFSSFSELWNGYAITSKDGAGNFKLPLLFILMLLPLVFNGGGKLSLDTLLLKFTKRDSITKLESNSAINLALVALVSAIALVWVLPKIGIGLTVLAVVLFIIGRDKSN